MKENNKKKIISLGIILALFIALPFGICYFSFAVLPLFDETTVKTSCGDTFQISYDSFRVKSLVTDTNSGFYVIINDKVAKEDIEVLDENPKTYRIKDVIFLDAGNGFELLKDEQNNKIKN